MKIHSHQSFTKGILFISAFFMLQAEAVDPGENWAVQTPPTASALYGVLWGNGQFIAVGAGGELYTSPDGISWHMISQEFKDD